SVRLSRAGGRRPTHGRTTPDPTAEAEEPTMATSPTAVAVFDTREQARRAVEELRRAGFRDAQIGVGARREGSGEEGASGPPTWETGAGIGAMLGASLGGLAAGPPGLASGAVVGLLLGALIDLEIPEEDAR